MKPIDQALIKAIETIHPLDDWVHLSTMGPDGGPHVTPMMMGIHKEGLLFSLTGKQKKRNLERDSRACVSISKSGLMAHVIVWGTIELRHDNLAQEIWNELIRNAFGESHLREISRKLTLEGTSLGIMTPTHYRIYGLED